MKLTQDHIQDLYKFTRAHYVEHYDLQTELVDHLANGIEQQWEKDSNLSFEEAKQKEFKKFGIFGFMDVVSKRQKAMRSRYRTILLRFAKEWFQLPKLIFSVVAITIIFLSLKSITDQEIKQGVIFGLSFILASVSLGYFYITRKDRELNMVRGGKKWMFGEMIFNFGGMIQLSNVLLQIGLSGIHLKDAILNNIWLDIFFSVTWVFIGIATFIALFVIPSKAEELLAETYPEYKFQQKM